MTGVKKTGNIREVDCIVERTQRLLAGYGRVSKREQSGFSHWVTDAVVEKKNKEASKLEVLGEVSLLLNMWSLGDW
jgi:hypothetical protein